MLTGVRKESSPTPIAAHTDAHQRLPPAKRHIHYPAIPMYLQHIPAGDCVCEKPMRR